MENHQQPMSLSKHQLHNTHLHKRSEVDQNCLAQILSSTPQLPQKYATASQTASGTSTWQMLRTSKSSNFYCFPTLIRNPRHHQLIFQAFLTSHQQNLQVYSKISEFESDRYAAAEFFLRQAHLAAKGLDLPQLFDIQLCPVCRGKGREL